MSCVTLFVGSRNVERGSTQTEGFSLGCRNIAITLILGLRGALERYRQLLAKRRPEPEDEYSDRTERRVPAQRVSAEAADDTRTIPASDNRAPQL